MNLTELKQLIPTTPTFLLDEDQVIANLQGLMALRRATGCRILYSMKALPLAALLELLAPHIDGISASSLFEAKLAREVMDESGSLHLTTPGLRLDEFAELSKLCSHISFNSLSQFQRLQNLNGGYSKGLRINPKLSFAADPRYDPCRKHSKLGVDIDLLANAMPEGIEGLHVHTVFGCRHFAPMEKTLATLLPLLRRQQALKWLNLGGGYLYNSITDLEPAIALIDGLKNNFGLEIFLEPGKSVVSDAAYLLTTVLDRFDSDGKTVLVLDTSINHHPEVFEYQRKPVLQEETGANQAGYSAILAGSTCMAGDLFGEYRFERLPEVGERLLFGDCGAYSLIKANRFNGYNLPDIYRIRSGKAVLTKHYEFEDYRRQWRG